MNKINNLDLVILSVLSESDSSIRFNALYREVKYKFYRKISKPTLSDHLKLLIKRGLIIRNVKDVQNVEYKTTASYPMLKGILSDIRRIDYICDLLDKIVIKEREG